LPEQGKRRRLESNVLAESGQTEGIAEAYRVARTVVSCNAVEYHKFKEEHGYLTKNLQVHLPRCILRPLSDTLATAITIVSK
jgi:hypothetical protein